MHFNTKKCHVSHKSPHYYKTTCSFAVLLYTLDSTILQRVAGNPYLGVEFSEDMKWSTHISKITGKACSTIGFLCRDLKHCPTSCWRNAYLSLVRSIIEYGAVMWDPYLQQVCTYSSIMISAAYLIQILIQTHMLFCPTCPPVEYASYITPLLHHKCNIFDINNTSTTY